MLQIQNMTQRDVDNLRFLLETKEKELDLWAAQADEDDFAYASELLQKAEAALTMLGLQRQDLAPPTPEASRVWSAVIAQMKGEVKPPVGQKGKVKRWK